MSLTNNQIWQGKQNADIVSIIEAAGTELRSAGGDRLKGLCPFHAEKTASFVVYRDEGRYHCYGCGAHGDVIDFVRQQRGLSFPEALRALGASDWGISKSELRAMQAKQRRQRAQEARERDLAYTLGTAIRIAENILSDTKNTDWEIKVLILQHLETFIYQHETLYSGDTDDRAALVRDLVTISPFPRGQLFNKDFDFNQWNWGASKKVDGAYINEQKAG